MSKSFRSGNPVTVAVVGLTVLTLAVLTAVNVPDLPLVGDGTKYAAEFGEAAGLTEGDAVRVAGVKVGKVSSVELAGDKVEVSFRAKDVWLGDRTSAAIKLETLLGKKYLALEPFGDDVLDPTEPIPRARTTTPYELTDAFEDLVTTVNGVDTNQLATSFDALSQTFANTPADVKGTLSGLSQLSDTLSRRDSQLSRLLANTRLVSATLADRDAQLVQLMSDGNQLLDEVTRRKQAISALLTGATTLSRELRGLVDDNDDQLDPVLTQLDRLTTMLQRNQVALDLGIQRFAPFVRIFTNGAGNGRWIDGYLCGLVLPSFGPVNEEGCRSW
ncbi:MCE family protein [Amycolatopsis sp.]|jgi:phospholipid/cholesterol/gamma-HCH transport system substrate-binding protein|uniref:MCE family protein n=1 Tax=Amycolatopsis sp. TaxID=37632 RepID=UPI002E0BF0D8|nr:MCE family protein [Amycolatopsis sp.]